MIINGNKLLYAKPIKNMLPTKVHAHGVSHGLGEAGYDIRIQQSIRFNRKACAIEVLDAKDHTVTEGRFVLASSLEEFDMPSNLVGIVHDKSTWARRGLSVFNTVIEPGWKGYLTLELVFHGDTDLVIPAGAGIAQVIFHKTAENAQYDGRYQHQNAEPVPARSSEND